MLKLGRDCDLETRVRMIIDDSVAEDPVTGAYLRRSHGCRQPGRPTRYLLCHVPGRGNVPLVAYSDAEAVAKGRQILAQAQAQAPEYKEFA